MRIDRKKLVCAMMDKNISVKELAEATGVSKTTISNIKNGKSCMDLVGNAVANALGVPVEELLDD